MRRRVRLLILIFIGSLALQTAWILAVPPFRGLDEIDHAFRAEAVAGGQWRADYTTPVDGRGNLVTVPRSLAKAARPECYFLPYTGYANCNPVSGTGNGQVRIASAAARYNPVFYWVVGLAGRAFSGATSLYAMRIASALLCSLMLTGIGWIVSLWSRSMWPWVGVMIAMTPVAIYSTMLPAPNGVEMLGGLGLWAALIGLIRARGNARLERNLIWAATPAAVCLVGVRALGPLWLAMVVLTCVAFLGVSGTVKMVLRNSRTWVVATSIVLVASAGAITWTLGQGTDSPSLAENNHFPDMLGNSLIQLLVWPFQSYAAFPARNELAPNSAYLLGFLVFMVFVAFSLRNTKIPRLRWTLVAVVVLSLVVPLVATMIVYSKSGAAWQGRYTLPYSMGIPLLASLTFDRPTRTRLAPIAVATGLVTLAVSYVICVEHVLDKERVVSPLAGTSEWWIPPTWLVALLSVVGLVMWTVAAEQLDASSK